MVATKRGIYVSPRMKEVLGPCGDGAGITPSSRINDIADRYGEILRRVQLPKLSDPEWNLLRDALNGVAHTPASQIRSMWQGVEDAILLDGLAAKWAVDGLSLIETLKRLRFDQEVALVEAVERWWRMPSSELDRCGDGGTT